MVRNNNMLMVIYALIIGVTLCYHSTARALDDFDLMKYGPDAEVEVKRQGFIVKMVIYDFPEKLTKAYENATGVDLEEGQGIRGFAVVNEFEDVCYVHIIPAKNWDDREAMAIMGHEIYHCTLADHKDFPIINETAQKEKETLLDTSIKEQDYEDLYSEDRRLELEWLKEDYEQMGIVITKDK